MRRSTFLNLCFFLALAAAGTAMVIKLMNSPPGGGGGRGGMGGMGGDTFILLSPVFFVVAAKRATRFGSASVVLAVLGVAFSVFGLYGALKGPKQPGHAAAPAAVSRPLVDG